MKYDDIIEKFEGVVITCKRGFTSNIEDEYNTRSSTIKRRSLKFGIFLVLLYPNTLT